MTVKATRLGDGPIITAATHPSIGTNIQGPSLIETPEWLPNRMGQPRESAAKSVLISAAG